LAETIAIAWSKDTVHEWRVDRMVDLFKDHTFSYDIFEPGKTALYSGHYTVSPDTIFLKFRGVPPAIYPYLIKEMSGGYLIQTFPGQKKRIFLQKQLLWWEER
jgi:hypothetical protein